MKELLKYPILVFSVILGVIFLDHFDYDVVSLGTSGIEIEKRITNTLVDAKALSMKVDSLEQIINSLAISHTPPAEAFFNKSNKGNAGSFTPSITPEPTKTLRIASDLTTKFNKSIEEVSKNRFIVGWVWIGEYNTLTNDWSDVAVREAGDAKPFGKQPATLTEGDAIVTMANLYIYDKLPETNDASRKSIGILAKGTMVEVQQKPISVDSSMLKHYWIKIKYETNS
ncbi:MAG: hypothetical protein RIF33_09035 [Cyclobacteriaceae bacterium]